MRLALALLLPLSAMIRSSCTTAYPGVDTELAQARYLGEAVRPSPANQFGAHAGAYHPWADPANAPSEPAPAPAMEHHTAPAMEPAHDGPSPAPSAPSAGEQAPAPAPGPAPEGPAAGPAAH